MQNFLAQAQIQLSLETLAQPPFPARVEVPVAQILPLETLAQK